MENPPGLFYLMKFYEHQKYLTVDRHLYSFHTTMINEDFFRSLPKEYQGLIIRAGKMALAAGRAASIIKESVAIGQLQEQGLEVYYPTPGEYAQFRDSGRTPAEKFVREQIGDAWVDDMLKAISESEVALSADGM